VVKLAGVSQSSVQRVEAETPVATPDSDGERTRRRFGRPSKLDAYRALLAGELDKQPDVLAVELLRRAACRLWRRQERALQRFDP
jgi:hypothetical protein